MSKSQISCPSCGQLLQISESHFGKTINCPKCNVAFTVTSEKISTVPDHDFEATAEAAAAAITSAATTPADDFWSASSPTPPPPISAAQLLANKVLQNRNRQGRFPTFSAILKKTWAIVDLIIKYQLCVMLVCLVLIPLLWAWHVFFVGSSPSFNQRHSGLQTIPDIFATFIPISYIASVLDESSTIRTSYFISYTLTFPFYFGKLWRILTSKSLVQNLREAFV